MGTANYGTGYRHSYVTKFHDPAGEAESDIARLETILAANAEIARAKAEYRSEREEMEALTMSSPMRPDQAFAHLGLLLGSFPPVAIFARFLSERGPLLADDAWVVFLLIVVNFTSAIVGYATGKLVGRAVARLEREPWWTMGALLPLIGLLWGMAAGGAGGFFVFVFGAFFGAVIGGIVGLVALPVFAALHRLLKRGDMIELKHFLPVAVGVTFTICALILGS